MSYGNVGPTTVSYTMASSIYGYVARMQQYFGVAKPKPKRKKK